MTRRLRSLFILPVAVATAFFAIPLTAQSATDAILAGNRAFAERNASEALQAYEKALAIDPHNYEALWRAAQTGVDLGEFESNADRRKGLYTLAEQRARLAVQANPIDAEGHFVLAKALGRTALSLGSRDRIKYAKEVREQALSCLKIAPQHSGCLHVMGMWNAEVMRLSGFKRMVAKNFLGGKIFDEASWGEAIRYMVESIKNDPRRVIHRLDLGKMYMDMERKSDAKTQFQIAANGPLIDYNDPHYKEEAARILKNL